MRLPAGRWAVLSSLAALIVGLGATTAARANLATLSPSVSRGTPGATINLTGSSFVVPRLSTGLPPTTVVIRWHDEDGPVLAEVTPDSYGSIAATVTIPDARPGTYVILGTQLTPRRAPGATPDQPPTLFAEPGTPARTSFEVLGAATGGPAAVATTATAASGELDATVWIVLTAAFGAVALSLFGGGLIAFVYQSRKAKQPAEARWAPPGWS